MDTCNALFPGESPCRREELPGVIIGSLSRSLTTIALPKLGGAKSESSALHESLPVAELTQPAIPFCLEWDANRRKHISPFLHNNCFQKSADQTCGATTAIVG